MEGKTTLGLQDEMNLKFPLLIYGNRKYKQRTDNHSIKAMLLYDVQKNHTPDCQNTKGKITSKKTTTGALNSKVTLSHFSPPKLYIPI